VVNVEVEQQTFPAVEVRTLLRKAQAMRNLTGDGPDGWTESNVDPAEPVKCFAPWLRLKAGCSLLGYVYRAGGNGNGVVYAIPAGLVVPPIPEGKQNTTGGVARRARRTSQISEADQPRKWRTRRPAAAECPGTRFDLRRDASSRSARHAPGSAEPQPSKCTGSYAALPIAGRASPPIGIGPGSQRSTRRRPSGTRPPWHRQACTRWSRQPRQTWFRRTRSGRGPNWG